MNTIEKIKDFFRQKFGKKQVGHIHRGSREFNERKFNKKPDLKHILFLIGLALVGLFLFGVLTMGLLIAYFSAGLPDVHDLDKISIPQSTTIYDREGNIIYVKHGDENRQYVSYDEISPKLVDATVAIEDDSYWQHPGFDFTRLVTAAVGDILHIGVERGASTITEQYIKNTFLTNEKSLGRKIQELILAVQLEQTFDKKKILELYLNKIPYGNSAYGIEKGSQTYFDIKAKDLDLAQSATLASIPQRPAYYDPYGQYKFSTLTKEFTPEELTSRNIQSEADLKDEEFLRGLIGANLKLSDTKTIYIQGRSDLVLKRMDKLGYINDQQMNDALAEMQKPDFIKPYKEAFQHQHFIFYILGQLEEKYGKDVVENGGLSVYTTLDPKLQNIAEKVVKDGALANEKKYNDKNAALVAMDPKTGQVLAMVGSRDYDDKTVDGNVNVAIAYRQPGSSFKPLVYAQAFYGQYGPGSVVFDSPLQLGGDSPKNFDGKFWGPMTIRKALGQSRNIPAIKAYFLGGGQDPIIALAEKMGINFQELQSDPTHSYGYPLAIGAAGVRLIDMVSAYSVFADGGVRHEPTTILKITNNKGDVLEQWQPDEGQPVLDPQIAYLITSILSDTSVRLSPNMTVPGQINAAKSGTSNGYKNVNGKKVYFPNDLLTFGYTTRLVAGVWTGNNDTNKDGTVSLAADGISTAAPIWKAFMTQALDGTPEEDFPVPDGIKEVQISKATGLLPSPLTPPDQITTDVFASFNAPTTIDDSYQVVDIDMLCGKLANEFTPEEMKKKVYYMNQHDIAPYPQWEKGVQQWLQDNVGVVADPNNPSLIIGPPPTESCPGRNAQNSLNSPKISFTSPANGSNIATGTKLNVTVSVSAPSQVNRVEFYLDNEFKYKTVVAPYDGLIRLSNNEPNGTQHVITAKVFDNAGYVGTANLNIMISSSTVQPNTNTQTIYSSPIMTNPSTPTPTPSPTTSTFVPSSSGGNGNGKKAQILNSANSILPVSVP